MPVPYAVSILYRALDAPPGGGIVLSTDKPDSVKSTLYRTRRELQADPSTEDPRLDELTIRTSPSNPSGEVWIVRVAAPPSPSPNGAAPP